jgi:hypothetical protein
MSYFDEFYGNKFASAKMLDGEVIRLTINDVKPVERKDFDGTGTKPALAIYCDDFPLPIVLSTTNALKIAKTCGTDEKLWPGAEIEVSPVDTTTGHQAFGIKVIKPPPGYGGNVTPIKPAPKPPIDPDMNDAVPF